MQNDECATHGHPPRPTGLPRWRRASRPFFIAFSIQLQQAAARRRENGPVALATRRFVEQIQVDARRLAAALLHQGCARTLQVRMISSWLASVGSGTTE